MLGPPVLILGALPEYKEKAYGGGGAGVVGRGLGVHGSAWMPFSELQHRLVTGTIYHR